MSAASSIQDAEFARKVAYREAMNAEQGNLQSQLGELMKRRDEHGQKLLAVETEIGKSMSIRGIKFAIVGNVIVILPKGSPYPTFEKGHTVPPNDPKGGSR